MKNGILFSLLLFISFFFTGCFGVDDDFVMIRNSALSGCGTHFETEAELALGSFELWLAAGIAGFAADDPLPGEVLDEISEVQLGQYKSRDKSDMPLNQLLKKIDGQLEKRGWKYFVKSREHNEVSGLYIKQNSRTFRELFIVNLHNNEIDLVYVKGNFERIIESAIRHQGMPWGKHNADWAAR